MRAQLTALIVAAVKAAAEPAPAVAATARGPPLPQVRGRLSSSNNQPVSLRDVAWATQAGEGWVLCDDLLRSSGGIRFGYSSPQVMAAPLYFLQANNG